VTVSVNLNYTDAMKRPAGLILTTIALGFLAFGQTLAAVSMFFAGFAFRKGIPASPATPQLAPAFHELVSIFSFIFGMLLLLFAVWSVLTIVGLLRLRNWGRVSTLVLAGILAGFGGLSCVAAIFSIFVGPMRPTQGGVSPQIIMGVVGLFYAVVAAVGVWWLIYFNRPAVRSLFVPPMSYPTTPYHPAYPSLLVTPYQLPPRKPGRFDHVPTPIAIIACLFLLSAVCCPLAAFLPFPAFMLGFIFNRPASAILYIGIGVLCGFIAVGLLRLDNRARITVMGFMGFGVVNMALSVLPWYQSQFRLYNQQMMEHFHFAGMPGIPTPYYSGAYIVMISSYSLILYGAVFYFIQRHRNAFLTSPPPPSVPIT
jgi:hypothetical protein